MNTNDMKQFTFRLTAEELESLRRRAKHENVAAGTYVRRCLDHQASAPQTAEPDGEGEGKVDLDMVYSAIRHHPYLQWTTVEGTKACEDVIEYIRGTVGSEG